MQPAREVRLAVPQDPRLVLRIALLPSSSTSSMPAPLLVGSPTEDALAEVQLLEGHEYLYEWTLSAGTPTVVNTEPKEVFQPDTEDGLRGRVRPGLSTGLLNVRLEGANRTLGELALEVRSRKLHYLSEYRWMLRDISGQMAELLMERFASSNMRFASAANADAATLYQRFAFLRALITGERFQSALNEVWRCPHVAWATREEFAHPGLGIKASSHAVRQLCKAGRRTPWPDGPILSIPEKLGRQRTEATRDTTPNRFVRFALERWRQVVAEIDHALARFRPTPAISRGRKEVSSVLDFLEASLSRDLMREVGALSHFPANDQVLMRREGYRDVLKAYVEFELAAQLSWKGAETWYSAGQRDVATLYEYWVFIQLADLVAEIVGQRFDLRPLVVGDRDGLSVALRTGRETVLSGEVERCGRKLVIDLCFNRTFGAGSVGGSWTRAMRPDYSLLIRASDTELAKFEPVAIHFDAKYRVSFIDELFGDGESGDQEANGPSGAGPSRGGVLRSDLLKMHAYRDAIRRSAGAYVIYPGEDSISPTSFQEYHELLPGLGAFALRPGGSGAPCGRGALRGFLEDVLDHVATRLTRHERGRFWVEETYGRYESVREASWASENEPLPDTPVLLGYVKSSEHWRWIQDTRTYNVRVEGRAGGVASNAALLYCHLLLLYCPSIEVVALARVVGAPERVAETAMARTGYPGPTSDYWCIQLSWLVSPQSIARLSANAIGALVQRLGKRKGEPTPTSWGALMVEASNGSVQ